MELCYWKALESIEISFVLYYYLSSFLIFACWVIFHDFLSSADNFQNKHFQKVLLEIP